jgi:WD40 repeat protein
MTETRHARSVRAPGSPFYIAAIFSCQSPRLARNPLLLYCVPVFPANPESHSSTSVVIANKDSTRVFASLYAFPGVIDWSPGDGTVRVALIQQEREGERPILKVETLTQLDIKLNNVPTIDFRPIFKNEAIAAELTARENSIFGNSYGATFLTWHDGMRRLGFFKRSGASGGNDKIARILDFASGKLIELPNSYADFFDNLDWMEFSPNGESVLTHKESSGFELFELKNVRKLQLPKNVLDAKYSPSGDIEIKEIGGTELLWAIPESQEGAASHLRARLLGSTNRDRRTTIPGG